MSTYDRLRDQSFGSGRERESEADDRSKTIAALQAALRDLAAGDQGKPWSEFDAEFRARHTFLQQ